MTECTQNARAGMHGTIDSFVTERVHISIEAGDRANESSLLPEFVMVVTESLHTTIVHLDGEQQVDAMIEALQRVRQIQRAAACTAYNSPVTWKVRNGQGLRVESFEHD